mmetsp:Transcript_18092/g.68342  ORF Transcript_18092/g.68342 Transcript_18092/m.68342 type:complete len:570 (+) Transcript_18092:1879-3588(+)
MGAPDAPAPAGRRLRVGGPRRRRGPRRALGGHHQDRGHRRRAERAHRAGQARRHDRRGHRRNAPLPARRPAGQGRRGGGAPRVHAGVGPAHHPLRAQGCADRHAGLPLGGPRARGRHRPVVDLGGGRPQRAALPPRAHRLLAGRGAGWRGAAAHLHHPGAGPNAAAAVGARHPRPLAGRGGDCGAAPARAGAPRRGAAPHRPAGPGAAAQDRPAVRGLRVHLPLHALQPHPDADLPRALPHRPQRAARRAHWLGQDGGRGAGGVPPLQRAARKQGGVHRAPQGAGVGAYQGLGPQVRRGHGQARGRAHGRRDPRRQGAAGGGHPGDHAREVGRHLALLAAPRVREEGGAGDHRRDSPAGRGQRARAGGDRQPHALHRGAHRQSRAHRGPVDGARQRGGPRRLARNRPGRPVQLQALRAPHPHGRAYPGVPGQALLPPHGHDEQAGVRRRCRALARQARPRLRELAAPDAPHRAGPHLALRHRRQPEAVPAHGPGGLPGPRGRPREGRHAQAHAGVRRGHAPRRPAPDRPRHRGGALRRGKDPGPGLHLHAGLGRQLPGAPGGGQGHRVL